MADERKWPLRLLGRRRLHDLGPAEIAQRNAFIHLIAANLPAPSDDPARRVIEPGTGTANLDLLATRQPEPAFDEGVLQHYRDVLEILVDQRRAGEAEGHAHHFARLAIDVDRADRAR